MKRITNTYLSLLTFLFIPILTLWNPKFISLMGVPPHWSIFWLFSWASIHGSFNGILAGLSIGIVLDSLSNHLYTQIPGFVICGIIFGKLSIYNSKNLNTFKFGFICSLGSLICNLLYFLQIIFHKFFEVNISWVAYGIKTISAQVFMTAIIAPLVCSWLFNIFNKNNSQNFSSFKGDSF